MRKKHFLLWSLINSFLLLALTPLGSFAQQTTMRDYVLFGRKTTQIGTSTTISGGRIGSYNQVITVGNTDITGDINSDNLVQLSNSNTIRGNISAKNQLNAKSVILSTGSNFYFPNNSRIDVGGDVTIKSGTINGTIYIPKGAKYTGPKTNVSNSPQFPTLPQTMPAVSVFPAPGSENITSTRSLTPNKSYGDLVLDGSKTVTFSGTGVYTFNSIRISNSSNSFVFDFGGDPTGFIVIQVYNDADLDKINVQLQGGGDASRVYTEIHGNGASLAGGTDAFRIANGASGSAAGIWYGAVWAPNGGIFVGQGSSPSKIEGALWSGTTVNLSSGVAVKYVQPAPCTDLVADAGPDQTFTCPQLVNATIGSSTSSGTYYKWTLVQNGVETVVGTTKTLAVTTAGTYKLTVSNNCGNIATDQVVVSYVSCIEPINTNPGKVDNLIGHELTYLATNLEQAKKYLFIFNDQYVLIEAVAVVGKESEALTLLRSLGLTEEIPNGLAYQVISGKFPINKLDEINKHPDVINHCRPVFLPVSSVGTTTSEGDKAIAADFTRGGFNIGGEGIKVGVISNSYNKREFPIDYALQDVQNGDLPGAANPNGYTTPVDLIKEQEYGVPTDEGRAMLQIVHDLAPKAALAFRTGFSSAGDLAQGIIDMKEKGCNVIVDDVTYITEPFFQDGVVSRAIDQVNKAGVAYFTSAGNFGQKSYASVYNPVPAPSGLTGTAHDFGGGDIYQKLKMKSGDYTIVLQWQDNIYSLAQTAGTQNDLDLYLVDPGGRTGFNRNNLNGDPFEVLSFSIKLPNPDDEIEMNLLITKANSSPDKPLIKYVIFRGNAVIAEYYNEQPLTSKSTIVGHANAAGAITVGAVLFSNTAPYNREPSTASFSSSGGTPVFVNGSPVTRLKPEITAPNGVNTSKTVPMGPDIDFITDQTNGTPDGFPNFYGTSAAAPHAAAVAALLMEARKKFYNETLTPDALRFYLFNSAQTMQPDGVVNGSNFKAGYGLVQPYGAIRAFANPTPKINNLVYDPTVIPGKVPFTLRITGDYLVNSAIIYFNDKLIPTIWIDEHTLEASIPTFIGNPPIYVQTQALGTTGLDGGQSNTVFFFDTKKLKVLIAADNQSKKYGEILPVNTATITVEGVSLADYNQQHGTALTLTSLGLDVLQLKYSDPNLNAYSDKGSYAIIPYRTFDPVNNETDKGLLQLYAYEFKNGELTIDKLAVTIVPKGFSVEYGGPLNNNIQFNYQFDPSAKLDNPATLTSIISSVHNANVNNSVLGVMNSVSGTAVVLFQNQVLPVFTDAVVVYQNELHPVLSGTNGTAVVILNLGTGFKEYPVVNGSLTGGAAVILNGIEYPVINGGGAVVILNGQIVPVTYKSDGSAVVILNGGIELTVTYKPDGSAVVILNGTEFPVVKGGGGAAVILNGTYYPVVKNADGSAAVILNGQTLTVTTKSDGSAVVILNGTEIPVLNKIDAATTILNGQLYEVKPSGSSSAAVILNGVTQDSNAPYLNGIGGSAAVILNGKIEPVFNVAGAAVMILNGNILPVTYKPDGSAVVILNGTEFQVTKKADGSAAVILNGTSFQVVSGGGGAAVILNGDAYSVTKKADGSAAVILNGTSIPVVNSVSTATLNNLSMSATLNAIANARSIGSQTNFVDVSANSFAQFNANSGNVTMFNTFASVNRTLVDANRIANGETMFVGSKGGAATILNGSGTYVNASTLSTTSIVRTPVIFDQADLNSVINNEVDIVMKGINMITGITAGQQYLIPATLFSPNFEISYGVGNVTITKAPLALKANDVTKAYGEVASFNPAGFVITSGQPKYKENVSLVQMASAGAAGNAGAGTYPLTISNAIGSYGTNISNYNVTYTNGTLRVLAPPCPVITHNRNNSFVSTTTSPVSLWMSVSVKVKGQLTHDGDQLVLRSGQLKLENVTYENSSAAILVKKGIVIAAQGVTDPYTVYDATQDVFITRVPVGFNSTADVFITGAIINSKNGFKANKNAGSVLSGIFESNVTYSGQWNYAMAAYSAKSTLDYVQYSQLAPQTSIVTISNSNYKAGTPLPWISRITIGGTGNGGSNYTGSPSNNDNYDACVVAITGAQRLLTSTKPALQEVELASDKELLVYPNPANNRTTVAFVPAVSGQVRLRVLSVNGTEIRNLYQGFAEAKKLYSTTIETQQWAKGVYLIQLILDNMVINRKLVVAR